MASQWLITSPISSAAVTSHRMNGSISQQDSHDAVNGRRGSAHHHFTSTPGIHRSRHQTYRRGRARPYGHAFAANLVEDGHQVFVYDREPTRMAALTGARAAAHVTDLASCEVVVTSLPDDDALAAVAFGPEGLVSVLAAGAVHVSTSTISPALSRRVAEEHALHRQDFVAAPVLGNPDFARARKIFVLAAGPAALSH
jgi:6-phosphogluconate dehydrogenase-like protein